MALITPFHLIDQSDVLLSELECLMIEASKKNILKFMCEKTGCLDLRNMETIDAQFWDNEMRKVIELQVLWGENKS